MKRYTTLAALATLLYAGVAQADPFQVTSLLTGDPRPDNPDNLYVSVSITGDTSSDETFWTVDINSLLHPDIKLDQFFFNLNLGGVEVSFADFTPYGWAVSTDADNAQGSGGADFLFTALDPSGRPDAPDITNSQDLTFKANLLSGTWSQAMFFDAPYSTSSDTLLGSFQLGAHLQSLTASGGMSDSGFAVGTYSGGTSEVPEPATMLLFGTGLAGLAGLARRKRA